MSRYLVLAGTIGAFALSACGDDDTTTTTTGATGAERTQETNTVSAAGLGEVLAVTMGRPEQVRLGEPFTYEIAVANVSDQPIEGVVIRQETPEGFELVQASREPAAEDGEMTVQERRERNAAAERQQMGREQGGEAQGQQGQQGQQPTGQQGQQQSGGQQGGQMVSRGQNRLVQQGQLRWPVGTMAPDQEVAIQITGIAHREGSHETCLHVDYDAPICQQWEVVAPELQLTRVLEQEAFWACDTIPVTYVLQNTGTGTTTAAVIRERLPDFLHTEDGAQVVELTVGPIEAGQQVEREVTLLASGRGEYRGFAEASTEALSVRSRGQVVSVLEPELELQVEAPQRQFLGRPTPVRVTVTNPGPDPARAVIVRTTAMQNVDRLDAVSDGEIAWDDEAFVLGDLAAGQSRSFRFAMTAAELGPAQLTLQADAYCLADETKAAAKPVAIEIVGAPAVRLEVIDEKDPVPVGETTTYTIEVKNQGSSEDLNLRLAAVLPATLQFVEAEGDTEVTADGQNLRFATVPKLDSGQSVTWQVVARAVKAGQDAMTLELASEASRSPVREQEPTNVVQ